MLEVKCATFGKLENNCYLITDTATNKSALIDCTEDSPKMREYVKDADLEYILLTHGHFDHIAGVKGIKELKGARVAISKEDEPMLTSSRKSLAAFVGGEHNDTSAEIIVSDGDELMLGETKIKVLATPGHTPGGVCYVTDECIFSGDTLFFCSCGRTDFPSSSPEDMQQSLYKIAGLKGDLKVYAGHDRESTLDFERKNNPYMKR